VRNFNGLLLYGLTGEGVAANSRCVRLTLGLSAFVAQTTLSENKNCPPPALFDEARDRGSINPGGDWGRDDTW
jgi:hypothetical protein